MPRVIIPIGPAHPSLKEPESFHITVEGERIISAEVKLGYNHRGIEKAAEARTYIQDIHLIERVCGICSHAHSTAFCMAVEEVAGLELPPRAVHIRTLIAELERVHSHLLWLGVAGHEIGFDTLLMYSWRDREPVMDLLAMLTGNRVNYGINTIGGVRRDVTREQLDQVLPVIGVLEERTKYYTDLALTDTTLRQRLKGVGHLSHDDACGWAPSGPPAAPRPSTATPAATTPTSPTARSTSGWSPTTMRTCTAGRWCGSASWWSPTASSGRWRPPCPTARSR